MITATIVLSLLLGLGFPADASHPAPCTLAEKALPIRPPDILRCRRRLARLCRLCTRSPGLSVCLQGLLPGGLQGVCDPVHACGPYTATIAECCAAGYQVPGGCTGATP
jgi:hypothetical protein